MSRETLAPDATPDAAGMNPDEIKQEDLRQILSLSPECNDLKKKYDACFRDWFATKFLVEKQSDMSPCTELLKQYSACVKAACMRLGVGINPAECPPIRPQDTLTHPHTHTHASKPKAYK